MTRNTSTIRQTVCATCGTPIHWDSQSYVSARWVHDTIAAMMACTADEVTPA